LQHHTAESHLTRGINHGGLPPTTSNQSASPVAVHFVPMTYRAHTARLHFNDVCY